MPLIPTAYSIESTGASVANGAVTSTSRTYNAGELVVVQYTIGNNNGVAPQTFGITNSAVAQTWTLIADEIPAPGDDSPVAAWWCVMSTTQAMTITAQFDQGGGADIGHIAVEVFTGQHPSNPVPVANVFSSFGGTDVSQSITPTATGSCLRMWAADWNASNSFVGATDCTLIDTQHDAGSITSATVRSTTDPRSNAAAFTIGETDTGGSISWIAFEIQAASPTATTTIAWIKA